MYLEKSHGIILAWDFPKNLPEMRKIMNYQAVNALSYKRMEQAKNLLGDYDLLIFPAEEERIMPDFYEEANQDKDYVEEYFTATWHYFHLLLEDGKLIALLNVLPDGEGHVLIDAYTHPDYRRRGYMNTLLHKAIHELEQNQMKEVLFPAPVHTKDFTSTTKYTDYAMAVEAKTLLEELSKSPKAPKNTKIYELRFHYGKELECLYLFYLEETAIGRLKISYDPESNTACMHHVGIRKAYRNQGYGKLFVEGALSVFLSQTPCKITLHVTSINTPALRIYKQVGFQIQESLPLEHLLLE